MSDFVTITPDGRFALDGHRWFCNSAIYYGRYPGSCGPDWFKGDRWARNAKEFDRDFKKLMKELYPDSELVDLPDGHAIWSARYPLFPGKP